MEMSASLVAALVPGFPPSDEIIQAVGRLETELERQIALREAADRAVARARDDHENAYERLVLHCRSLEEEKVRRSDASLRSVHDVKRAEREHADATARKLDELSQAFERRSQIVEQDHRAAIERLDRELAESRDVAVSRDVEASRLGAERDALGAERDVLVAERDALGAERDVLVAERDVLGAERDVLVAERDVLVADRDVRLAAGEEREGNLVLRLAETEERFRVEAFHLSALIALRSQEAQAAQAEIEALKHQLASVFGSSSWKFARPLRGASRLMRRLRCVPSQLIRVVRPRP